MYLPGSFLPNNPVEVLHPPTPYDASIPQGLLPGKQIIIRGQVRPHADKFAVNLVGQSGIALHINPRFNENVIIRNTEKLGNWGIEDQSGAFPLRRGESFDMTITVEQHKYQIVVNGHSYEYLHRVPYQEVQRLKVDGDIDIHRIAYSAGGADRHPDVHNPHVPFALPIQYGAAPGRMIQILGQVPMTGHRFTVNLQNGPGETPPDINMHFDVRVNDRLIVRNSRKHTKWGQEERHKINFPFQRGQNFDMLILIDQKKFNVAVNGQHLLSFPHRNPMTECNHIGVIGDVIVHSVKQF